MQYRYAVMHAGTLGIQNSKADSLSVPEELGLHSDTNTIQHISDTLSLKKKKVGHSGMHLYVWCTYGETGGRHNRITRNLETSFTSKYSYKQQEIP